MNLLHKWLSQFRGTLHPTAHDRDLADEIESHLQLHIDDNLRAGLSPAEARRQALLKFGGVESAKEAYRARRGLPFFEILNKIFVSPSARSAKIPASPPSPS